MSGLEATFKEIFAKFAARVATDTIMMSHVHEGADVIGNTCGLLLLSRIERLRIFTQLG